MEEDDLLCQEIECLYRPGDVDEDFVKMLADEEINFGFSRDKSSLQSQEIKRARFDSITWMIKVSLFFQFHFLFLDLYRLIEFLLIEFTD